MGRLLKFLLLVVVLLGAALYFYQRNIAAVPVSAADIEKGGSFSAEERSTLKTACVARIKKDGEKVCGCIADKAASEISRFDRLVMTAGFQEKLADVVALTKGLVQSGIPIEKVKAAEDGSKTRVKEILKTCNAAE